MNCDEAREHFVEHVLNEHLNADVDAAIESHLNICGECRHEIADIKRIINAVAGNNPNSNMVSTASRLVQDGLSREATHIHIDLVECGCEIRFRIRGRLCSYSHSLDLSDAELLIARFKHMAGVMDLVSGSAKGLIPIRYHDMEIEITASFFQTARGASAVIDLRRPEQELSLRDVGFSDDEISRVKNMLDADDGVIVLVGIPTPALARIRLALASYLVQERGRIVYDIAEGPRPPIHGVIGLSVFSDLAATVSQAMGYDPDVISLLDSGRLESLHSVGIRAKQGLSVIIQFHADSSAEALQRLYAANEGLASSIKGIIHQREVVGSDGNARASIFEISGPKGELSEPPIQISDSDVHCVLAQWSRFTFEDSTKQRLSAGAMDGSDARFALENRFSKEAMECLRRARMYAANSGGDCYRSEHLFASILQAQNSEIQQVLSELGLDIPRVLDELQFSVQEMDESSSIIYPSPRISIMLRRASDLAVIENLQEITLKHLLRVVAEPQGLPALYLLNSGVTAERLDKALGKAI